MFYNHAPNTPLFDLIFALYNISQRNYRIFLLQASKIIIVQYIETHVFDIYVQDVLLKYK